jgi:hypothetical protein
MSAGLTACSLVPAAPSPVIPNTLAASDGPLSLHPSEWQTISSPARFPLASDASGHLMFNFPAANGAIGYLYTAVPQRAIGGTLSVSLQITTSGAVLFNYLTEPANTCATPASVRPMIWAHKNSWNEFDRWWSNPDGFMLAGGVAELTVPLTPDRWSSVYGKLGNADAAAMMGFASALGNVSSLGLTFGGGCYFGHGVYVQGGDAQFVLLRYEVRR